MCVSNLGNGISRVDNNDEEDDWCHNDCWFVIGSLRFWDDGTPFTPHPTRRSLELCGVTIYRTYFFCKCLGSASKREDVQKRLKTSERLFDPSLKYTSKYSGTNLTQSHPPWKIVGSANTAPSPSPNLDLLCVKKECNNQFWSTMPIQEHDKKKGRQRTSFQHLRRHFYSAPKVRAR